MGQLQLENDWDSVVDEAVVKVLQAGNYGSRKPGNESYKLNTYLVRLLKMIYRHY